MKLKLQIPEEATAVLDELLRFSPSDYLITSEPEAVVYLSLEEACALPDLVASVHIHADFCLVVAGEQSAAFIANLAKQTELYTFADDGMAIALLGGLPFHAITRINSFYLSGSRQKVLLLSSRREADLILSGDPGAFLHILFAKDACHFSVAGDLGAYNTLDMARGLKVLRDLNLSDCMKLSFPELRAVMQKADSSYSFFADHYDSYMAHVDYDLWMDNLISWHQQYGQSRGKKALELACGTANVGSRMVVAGYDVDACDLSPQMLINAAGKEVKPKLYQASMTDPIPGRDYDLIFCLFDSINYLTQTSEVRTCLAEVKKALAPGGIFIFDISTLLNSLENFADNCNYTRNGQTAMVHEAWYESYHHRQISRLSCYTKQGPLYALKTEEHQQRVYMCSELLPMIEASGLKLLAIHSSKGKTNLLHKRASTLDKQYHRLFFILGSDGL
ncbi:MAG TPA: class I SAM-dependent methyltransferase [Candidatus Cloacimonadota bacterium]|nr:class I SAM-dependent methyltransferase [Candidatus Cloacimonadota bacterium]